MQNYKNEILIENLPPSNSSSAWLPVVIRTTDFLCNNRVQI